MWNPSSDSENPVFAFVERALPFLRRWAQTHHLFLIAKVASDSQKAQVQS